MKCPKCDNTHFFKEINPLTGNTMKVPCLCPIKVSKEEAKTCVKIGLKLGRDFIIEN